MQAERTVPVVGASPRGCPDDSADAEACRVGLLRIAREAARERKAGSAARTILG